MTRWLAVALLLAAGAARSHRDGLAGGQLLLAAAEQVTAERELATGGPLRSTGGSRLAPDVVFDVLSQLVDKSMVVVEEHERGPHFKFLETIRHFAREQLHITGESEHIAEQHAYYFVQLAESAHALMAGPEQLDALYRLRQDYANLRAAMDWALARQDTDTSLRLAGALGSFWRANGEYAEGSERLRRALSLSWSAAHRFVRARALNAAVLLMGRAGHLVEARAYGEEGLALEDLRRIAAWRRRACDEAGVALVAGDTKVVDRGKGDQIFISTTGVGLVPEGRSLSIRGARPGDRGIRSRERGDLRRLRRGFGRLFRGLRERRARHRQRWNNNLVSGANVLSGEHSVHGRRTVDEGDRKVAADQIGERTLQP